MKRFCFFMMMIRRGICISRRTEMLNGGEGESPDDRVYEFNSLNCEPHDELQKKNG